MNDDKFDTVSPMKNPTQYLNQQQIDSILDSIQAIRDKVLFTTLAYTGRRVSEIVKCLKPKDIDMIHRMINYTILKRKDKAGEDFRSFLAINEMAYNMLVKYIEFGSLKPDEYVFDISRQRTDQLFKKYCYNVGILTVGDGKYNKPHVHCLRHSFAIIAAKKCDTLYDVIILQKLLGHARIETTMWYIDHFNPIAQRELLGKMFKKEGD